MFQGRKDLLGLRELTAEQIERILDTALAMKEQLMAGNKTLGLLKGKCVVTVFYENSTRTRLSFELAAKYLGAIAANISVSASSVAKGETLIDTARTIDRMQPDAIVMRHSSSGAAELVARNVNASVINAGDGMHEHPTQALLDLFTIREKKGQIKGLKVAIVGDLSHSRVARSNLYGLLKMGASVSVAAPATLMPAQMEQYGASVFCNVDEAITGADVVMGLRMQTERQKARLLPSLSEYSHFFGIDAKRLSLAKPDALLLHPGPVNRGVELTTEVVDGVQSVIDEQVTNGVAIRMAVLQLLCGKEGDCI